MTTRIATLKALISVSNQQSWMEALCPWFISSLCGAVVACVQCSAGASCSERPSGEVSMVAVVLWQLPSEVQAAQEQSVCHCSEGTRPTSLSPNAMLAGRKVGVAEGVRLWQSSQQYCVPPVLSAWVPALWLHWWQAYSSCVERTSSLAKQGDLSGQQWTEFIQCTRNSELTRHSWHSGAQQWLIGQI